MDGPTVELMSALASYVPSSFVIGFLLSRLFFRLFVSGKYSDLTIVCGAKRYSVHRALLATRSTFFEGACRNGFQEAQSGLIDLSEDDAEAVEHMVHCMYKDKTTGCKTGTH